VSSSVRLNAGPYFGFCASGSYIDGFDIGLNTGVGIDVGRFYIGMIYEYGFLDVSSKFGYNFYNRTYGVNLGINL
jgi:hypothetical protein